MQDPQGGEDWGFSSVIKLVYTLSASRDFAKAIRHVQDECAVLPDIVLTSDELLNPACGWPQEERDSRLGNFDEIWKFLGQDLDIPPPSVESFASPESTGTEFSNDSDDNCNGKLVRWQDEIEGADLEDNDLTDGFEVNTGGLHSTKTQRKREARKKRRQELVLEKIVNAAKSQPAVIGNGNEFDSVIDRVTKQSRDRRVLIQQIINGSPTRQYAPPSFGYAARLLSPTQHAKHGMVNGQNGSPLTRANSATLAPTFASSADPKLATAADRKAKLMSKLYAQFIEERQFLKNVSLLPHVPNGTQDPSEGIHVFVDISNILIGFHDALKLSRGLPFHTRIRRQPLSFHNLSLILERGRPVSKRVVAGSDNIDSVREAALLGYETNILDRVHKAKPPTPYQKRQRQHLSTPTPAHALSGPSSGSETAAPEKWVEQAVDEILHLKILESVVDATRPSTIVLATGDAAQAEYSEGFLKMVERALAKGWRVELVSFRHNTSGAYRKREFRARWGEAFRIMELDEFVELLLGADAV